MSEPLRVLVHEDDETDRMLVVLALERYGYAVASRRTDCAEAFRDAVTGERWDVIVADYHVPGFNGAQALELVRSLQLDVPFILVTAMLGDEKAVELMRRGADDYVLKDRLARLGFSVERVVREYGERREREQAQKVLASIQRRFQQSFDHAPVGVVHIDLNRRFRMANDRFCTMVGYTREELADMTVLDLTHPEDVESSLARLTAMEADARSIHRAEKRYVRKDGKTIWVDLIATAVRTPEGAVDYTLGTVEDITGRKETSDKIRLQAHLLDAVEQAVIATGTDGRITYWSRFACGLYGWTEREAVGQHILDVVRPLTRRTCLTSGERWSGELLVTHRDGHTFPAMVINSPLYDEDGTMIGMVGVSFDLTERKAAEAALRRSEERHRGVIEGVVEIIISVLPDGTITSVNRAFEDATQYMREEVIGRRLWELLPADEAVAAPLRLEERLRDGSGGAQMMVTGNLLRKNGKAMVIDGVAYVSRGEGEATEVFYFIRDVTDRRHAEEARERLDRQFRLVLESTDEGIYAVDAAGNCTLMNRAAAQILGVTAEEVLGRNLHELTHHARPDGTPYAEEDCPELHALRQGVTQRVRGEVFWRRDGRAVPVEYATAPLLENGEIVGAVTTFCDVSLRRMLESQLETANRLNGLGRVAVTIAHEFNNVLMGIQPFVEILRNQAGDNARMLTPIARILNSIQRGKRVTSEILQFTRQSEPAKKPLDVSSWVADLTSEAREVLGRQIELTVRTEEGLTIAADSAALQQVFMNILVNSRDALAGTGRILLTVCRAEGSLFPFGVVEQGDRFAHFQVADNGPGMAPETMQRIFEPLFTTKKSGTGIGLALAHHVVRQHGGHIFVESEEGAGATFHIFLPLTAETARPKTPPVTARPEKLRSLVLVEDDASVAAGLVALLSCEQVSVDVATTGAAALPVIQSKAPDAVVLDIGLPDMDGTMVYEAIARRWPHLPVVFATGHADASRLHAYLTKPNVGHVLKPYELTTLYQSFSALTEGVG
jgi:two-component system cell cycle sensor histidine kinase/response regulator CckA